MKQKYTSGSAVASFVFGTVPRAHRREKLLAEKKMDSRSAVGLSTPK
jgi:hypothetical protein